MRIQGRIDAAATEECWDFIAQKLLEAKLREVFGRKRYKRWAKYPPRALLRRAKG